MKKLVNGNLVDMTEEEQAEIEALREIMALEDAEFLGE